MKIDVKRGFIVYKTKGDYVIACPHSGPALERTTSRDDNSETVGSILWKLLGGKLVVGNLPRDRVLGVDFNRDIPDVKTATSMYSKASEADEFFEYRKRYAWVAEDENDYEARLKIYQNFWAEIESGSTIILVHRQFNRLKSLPGIMDFIELKGKKKDIMETMTEVNREYSDFFKKVDRPYKQAILFETERIIANIIKRYGSFNLRSLNREQRAVFSRDLKIISKYCRPYILTRLKDNVTAQNYVRATKSTLENSPKPCITFQNVFNGELAHGPKRKLNDMKDKSVMEVEGSHFINLWYPEVAAEIIKNVIEELYL